MGQSSIEKMAGDGYAQRFSDSTASIRIQLQALDLARKSRNTEDQAICYAYLAMTHRRLLHLKEFGRCADTAYYLAEKAGTVRARAYGALAMGSLKSYIDDRSSALDYYLDAYKLFAEINLDDQCAKLASDISYLFSPAMPDNVKKYADVALQHAIKSGDPESLLYARLAVGSYLIDEVEAGDMSKWPEAITFFEETITFAEKEQARIIIKSNIGIAYVNQAALYLKKPSPDHDEAFMMRLAKTIQIAKQYNLKNIYRSAIGMKGQYFTQKGDFAKAESLFKEGIAYQKSLPYTDNYMLVISYDCLKDLAVKRKDYAAYYGYDTLFMKYNRLKYDEATREKLQNADMRYESAKKISRINQLEQENKLQQKNKLLGYGISAVLLIGMIFMYRSYYFRQRYYLNREEILLQQQNNSQLRMELMEKETLENLSEKLSLERRLLRSQMDPHFIFNALGNIQSMVLQQDTAPAVSYLSKFAKLTRQVLEHTRMESISLQEEINTLENYISLQQLRFNDHFQYEIICEEGLDLDIKIPPLLIQPFVENAIEHGLKPLMDIKQGLLSITFIENKAGNFLTCMITDNGIGLSESMRRKGDTAHRSMSTAITNERLSLMLEDNPHIGFEVSDGIEGCIVTLRIPIG